MFQVGSGISYKWELQIKLGLVIFIEVANAGRYWLSAQTGEHWFSCLFVPARLNNLSLSPGWWQKVSGES